MPSFKSDLNQETLLSEYLDNLYRGKKIDFQRVFDLDKQHQGIDIVIQHNSVDYFIDEKAQLHYLNKDLPTFTFELSYLKNNKLKDGWLFADNKLTQYYFLITGIFLKKGKSKLLNADDIDKLKITSVNKIKLIEHLTSIGLEKSKLLEYDLKLRESNSFGKNKISELNPQSEGLIFFTKHLIEKPINLQLKLAYLIENKIAKKFHYV
jgi:hypothetical protein